MQSRFAASCLLAAVLLVAGSSARAAVRAVVIGVDHYREVRSLRGAVADALDVSAALRGAGAAVTTLRDEEVTREALFAAWHDALAGAQAEDMLVLFFAGHGIQIPDRDGDELDRLDEAFVLPAFRPGIRDDAGLLTDDEIDRMVRDAAPRLVAIVADTCHSGTLVRAVDERADFRDARFLTRSVYGDVEGDLPAAGPVHAAAAADNAVLFAAVPEDRVVREMLIEGQVRGALSWSFARGLEGAADVDGDGAIRVRELAAYVAERVRALTDSRQTPVVTARGGSEIGLFPRPEAVAEVPPEASEVAVAALAAATRPRAATREAAALRLAVAGPQAADGVATIAGLDGVEIVTDTAAADLIWHLPSGDVLTAGGDVAARLGPTPGARLLQAVVAKWRLLRALDRQVDGTLGARILPDDRLYHDGAPLSLELVSQQAGHLVLFDLAADGSVVVVLPQPDAAPAWIAPGAVRTVPLRAGPPFGADHLVAVRIADAASMTDLLARLRAAHGRPFEMAEVEELAAALGSATVALTAVQTAP